MDDLVAKHAKLISEADDCQLISQLAPDPEKRAVFERLAIQLRAIAREVEDAIRARSKQDGS
jgi:hypothetical protein